MCIIAEKKSIATKKLKVIVQVTRTANLLKRIILPPNKNTPDPKVVMLPLRMLTPISFNAYCIFPDRVCCGECM